MYGTPLISYTLSTDASTFTISGISTSYKHLGLVWTSKQTTSEYGPQAYWQYNASTAAGSVANWMASGYEQNNIMNQGYGPESYIRQRSSARLDAGANVYTFYRTIIPNYSSSNTYKSVIGETIGVFGGPYTSALQSSPIIINTYNSNDQLTSILFSSNWTSLKAGCTVYIYGLDA
jgi:hypothetical protein